MPSPTTCHQLFDTAREKRKAHPLHSGGYKLKEAGDRISKLHELVTTIAERVRAGGKFEQDENLGPCMATERGAYLKGIPAQLAELLGYTILPAIAALEGDGMPKAEVERLLSRAETDAQRLLDDCEALRQRLKGGISREYDAMRRGESALLRLLDAAISIVRLREHFSSDPAKDTAS
jgi:hypothetical protein